MPGIAEPHSGFLLQLLGPHFAKRIDFGQFIGAGIDTDRRQHVGRQFFGHRVGSPLGDRADHCGGGVVGITAEGCLRQPLGCVVGARGLGLPRKGGERRGFAADSAAGQVEPLTAEQRQERARCVEGIAGEFLEIGMLFLGRRGRHFEHNRRRRECGLAGVEQHLDGDRLKRTPDQYHRVAIAAKGRHPRRQHPRRCV